jgi:hypothetical protein
MRLSRKELQQLEAEEKAQEQYEAELKALYSFAPPMPTEDADEGLLEEEYYGDI